MLAIRVATAVLLLSIFFVIPSFAVIPSDAQTDGQADPSEWRSVLLFRSANSFCSSVVIGPRVLLTAAHCVGNEGAAGAATLSAAIGETTFSIECRIHPNFKTNQAANYSLCLTNQPLTVTNIERVSSKPPSVGDNLTLVGYGCRNALTRSFDGRLSAGTASVQPLPRGTQSPHAVLTGALACSGDSGGGVFEGTDSARTLSGIISASDQTGRTWISATSSPIFLGWAREWSREVNSPICGIDANDGIACTSEAITGAPTTAEIKVPNRDNAVILANAASAPSLVLSDQPQGNTSQHTRQLLYRPNDKIADVILGSCAAPDEAFLHRSLGFLAANGMDFRRDHVFSERGTLLVPICPSSKNTVEIEISEGSPRSLWFYWDQLSKQKRLDPTFEWRRPPNDGASPRGRESKYFFDVFIALNPSQPEPAALRPGKIVLPLRRAESQVPAVQSTEAVESYEVLAAVSGQPPCNTVHDPLTYPFNIVGLLDVLMTNAELRESREVGHARVFILDSGLYLPDQRGSHFRGDTLYFSDRSIAPASRRSPATVVPRVANPIDAAHGTWVATAALGGSVAARMQFASTGKPRVRLDPFNLYETSGPSRTVVRAESVRDFVDNAVSRTTGYSVVNLSFRATKPMPSLEARLGKVHKHLFVVAAGNGAGDGNNIGQLLKSSKEAGATYPASYAGSLGSGYSNLIAVAALVRQVNGSWQIADFSDFNPEIVEIGAPGCAIPVLHYDESQDAWLPKNVSGTSFAAPLVSFTAALLMSEFEQTVPQVKQRILASADINPHLIHCITDGRSLNIVKALSVRLDVIELREPTIAPSQKPACYDGKLLLAPVLSGEIQWGNVKLFRGENQIHWNQRFPIECQGTKAPPLLSSILKIVPSFNVDVSADTAPKYPDRIYVSMSEDQQPKALDCKLPDDVSVVFERHGGKSNKTFAWKQLRDLVFRVPDQRG